MAVNSATKGEPGFSLVETMIALLILGGGLLALAMAFSQGLILVSGSHYHQIAKEKASEAMESVFTARDAGKISTWDAVQNQGSSPNGVFLDGDQPLRNPGDDGLINTDDDGDMETLVGPDGLLGTTDDEVLSHDRFGRQIEITNISANLRRIRIIIRYTVRSVPLQYRLTSYISRFA